MPSKTVHTPLPDPPRPSHAQATDRAARSRYQSTMCASTTTPWVGWCGFHSRACVLSPALTAHPSAAPPPTAQQGAAAHSHDCRLTHTLQERENEPVGQISVSAGAS